MDKALSRQAKLLLLIIGLFTLGNGFSGIFVNIYLWRLNNNLVTITLFNFYLFLFVLISFPLAGWISKKKDASLTLRLSLIFYALFYLLILVLNINSGRFIYILGMLMGVALAFYALSIHVLTYDLTHNGNRDVYYGINGAVTSLAGILPPVVSGFIIVNLTGLKGYYIIFTITLILFIITGFLSLFLKGKAGESDYYLKEILFIKDENWKTVLRSQGLMGLRDGIYSFAINIIIFMVLKNEMDYGQYAMIFSFSGLITFFILRGIYKMKCT